MNHRSVLLLPLSLALLAAFAPGAEDPPPPAPAEGAEPAKEVEWGVPEGPLPPLSENRRNTPQKARDAALDWLGRHQGKDGSWAPAGFHGSCVKHACPGKGLPLYTVGVTALATLAHLRAGKSPGPDGEGARVAAAIRFLLASQDPEGAFGSRENGHWVYEHALAILALSEARGTGGDPRIDAAVRRGLDVIRAAQNPYLAWGYGVRVEPCDTSIAGWMTQALRAATRAGFEVEPRVFDGVVHWLGKVRNGETGRFGYRNPSDLPPRANEMLGRFPPALSESTTASGLLSLLLCGVDRKDARVTAAEGVVLARLPAWDAKGSIDFYYWYYGTEAEAWLGRDGWRKWSRALEEALLPWQRGEKDGCAAGSWDPLDPFQTDGGRVYMTALGALMAGRLSEKR